MVTFTHLSLCTSACMSCNENQGDLVFVRWTGANLCIRLARFFLKFFLCEVQPLLNSDVHLSAA